MKELLEAFGRIFSAAKDLPLWLLVALAAAADILQFAPHGNVRMPANAAWWLWVAVVVFNTLAVFRAVSLVHHAWHELRAATRARRTFHLTPVENQCHWGMTKQSDGSVTTQMSAYFLAKNVSNHPVGLARVRLVRPRINGEILSADISVRSVNSNLYGSAVHSGHVIPARLGLPAHAHLLIHGRQPGPRDAGEPLDVTLAVADDDGNEQRVKVRFRGLGAPQPNAVAEVHEAAFAIAVPVTKEVVSVLQSELARYNKCGRQQGGLGSLHVVYQGQALQGVGGTDAWNANSPKNQSIVEDPDAATLQSDNLDALLALHKRLANEEERNRFVSALLDRLDGNREYLRISYFIVCVLWKVGRLKEALARTKTLPVGEIKVFGLSNALLMFNGVLRYRYPDFTPEMLDDIENLIHGLEEPSFQIREKISSIRARRLLARPA